MADNNKAPKAKAVKKALKGSKKLAATKLMVVPDAPE
jgi:hypothetical protein